MRSFPAKGTTTKADTAALVKIVPRFQQEIMRMLSAPFYLSDTRIPQKTPKCKRREKEAEKRTRHGV